MAFRNIADLTEIAPGTTKFLLVEGRPVVLARVGEEVFAMHGRCPHRNNPLEGATLMDHLIDCPWHHFQYDVRTGRNHFPSNVYPDDLPRLKAQLRPMRTYPVEVRGTEIWVNLK